MFPNIFTTFRLHLVRSSVEYFYLNKYLFREVIKASFSRE